MPEEVLCPLGAGHVLRLIPLKVTIIRDTFSEMTDAIDFLRMLPMDVAVSISSELFWEQEFGPPAITAQKLLDRIVGG